MKISGFENAMGSRGTDILYGSGATNVFEGNNGADHLLGMVTSEPTWPARVASAVLSSVGFAKRAGVSPGIVVGQMQKHHLIRYDQLNFLKTPYNWSQVADFSL